MVPAIYRVTVYKEWWCIASTTLCSLLTYCIAQDCSRSVKVGRLSNQPYKENPCSHHSMLLIVQCDWVTTTCLQRNITNDMKSDHCAARNFCLGKIVKSFLNMSNALINWDAANHFNWVVHRLIPKELKVNLLSKFFKYRFKHMIDLFHGCYGRRLNQKLLTIESLTKTNYLPGISRKHQRIRFESIVSKASAA